MIYSEMRYLWTVLLLTVLNSSLTQINGLGCVRKDFGYGSFVCVCNSTQCDSLAPVKSPASGRIIIITSDKESKRWNISEKDFNEVVSIENEEAADVTVRFLKNQLFQKILGFGGAFTDSTGINMFSLSPESRSLLIRSYFDSSGLEYNLGRVPIAGTDFSTHPYSYDDLGPGQIDSNLDYFGLTKEDLQFKIPYIKEALNLCTIRGVNLKLYGSPWSAPGWMKDNGKLNGKGKLLKEFYPTYVSYIIKFLDAYKDRGIYFYGLTAQNEPTTGLLENFPFNAMGWMPDEQAEWIGIYLGPRLNMSGYGNLKIFVLDDFRALLPTWVDRIMQNKEAAKYVGGVAVHWYQDGFSSPERLDLTHFYHPQLPILYTEACAGWAPWDLKKVIPGSWVRAEDYAADIIENLQHWVVGWTDWNMALDLEGGPNWVNNKVDSPILVNQAQDEFYKQPTYYALAHFTKVLPAGSTRIGTEVSGNMKNAVEIVSFERLDGSFAAIFLNRNHNNVSVEVIDGAKRRKVKLNPRSITSIVWRS